MKRTFVLAVLTLMLGVLIQAESASARNISFSAPWKPILDSYVERFPGTVIPLGCSLMGMKLALHKNPTHVTCRYRFNGSGRYYVRDTTIRQRLNDMPWTANSHPVFQRFVSRLKSMECNINWGGSVADQQISIECSTKNFVDLDALAAKRKAEEQARLAQEAKLREELRRAQEWEATKAKYAPLLRGFFWVTVIGFVLKTFGTALWRGFCRVAFFVHERWAYRPYWPVVRMKWWLWTDRAFDLEVSLKAMDFEGRTTWMSAARAKAVAIKVQSLVDLMRHKRLQREAYYSDRLSGGS